MAEEPSDGRIPTFTQIREVLAASLHLRALNIRRYLKHHDTEEGPSTKPAPVSLPILHLLDLITSIQDLTRIMFSLKLSGTCHVSVEEQRSRNPEYDSIDANFPTYLTQFKPLMIPLTVLFSQKHFPRHRSATVESMFFFSFAASTQEDSCHARGFIAAPTKNFDSTTRPLF